MKQTLLNLTFIVLVLAFRAEAQMGLGPACKMSKDYKFNFFLSPENKTSGLFGPMADRLPPTVISNCHGASGKYIGFGLGLRRPYMSSDVADVSFDGQLRKEVCDIQNSPVSSLQPYDEKLIHFQEQFHLLRSCTSFELTHLDNKPIQFDAVQNYCHMKRLSNGKVVAEGDFCYLRINPDLRVAISILLNPDCLKQEFLDKNKIYPRDLEALLQAFIVDDQTSIVTQDMIGSTQVRLSLMPDSKLISVNQDIGPELPRFPVSFAADIHQGPIIIKDGSYGDDKKILFDISLFLDSRSNRHCLNGSCVGPGDYQIPIAGELEFFEILPGEKRSFLDSWYAGNPADTFAKTQWQGLFRFSRKVSEGLEVSIGKTYEIETTFYNPYDDYFMLINGYQQILIDLTLMNGTAGKDFIRPLNSLNSLLGLPQIPVLPTLGSVEIEEQLEKVRQIMQRLGHDQTFPPYYQEVCNPSLSLCQKMNAANRYLILTTRFTVVGLNPEDQSYKISNIITTRRASYVPSYQRTVPELPKLVCQP